MTKPCGASEGARIRGRGLHPGRAAGPLKRLDEPVSFWGGVSADGVVIDVHHGQRGSSLTGCVLAMTAGRGSSSASSVLAEQIRAGTAPAAIVVTEPDVILVLGAVVAAELYGRSMPIIRLAPADFASLPASGWAEVDVTMEDLVLGDDGGAGGDSRAAHDGAAGRAVADQESGAAGRILAGGRASTPGSAGAAAPGAGGADDSLASSDSAEPTASLVVMHR